jgi:2-methylisocitrate lyase-like PEP mutase family enzyme
MTQPLSQREKYDRLYALHHAERLLVLPNIWDSLGALLLHDLGYPAIATASAAIAFTNGYNDGEKIPFTEVLNILKRIAAAVNVPVTADIESGFAESEKKLSENIQQLLAAGISGINFEDTDKNSNTLYPIEMQTRRIEVIKKVSDDMGVPLFINARTDVYLRGQGFDSPEAKLEETIKRGLAYKAAGADCFFPLAIKDRDDIAAVVRELQMPVNVLLIRGVPALATLQQLGIKRVSLGPGFLKIAIRAMKDLALKLQQYDGFGDVTGNDITSDYLIDLVSRNDSAS